jgi:hypothetical protein
MTALWEIRDLDVAFGKFDAVRGVELCVQEAYLGCVA